MHISFSTTTPDGQEFVLELSSGDLNRQQESDLDFGDARARIHLVLQRELQRCAEIAYVAMQDAHMARRLEKVRLEQKRAGTLPPKGPSQILGAGTKDQAARLIEHKGRMIPAPDLKQPRKEV